MSKHTPGPWRIGYWAGQCHKPEHRGCHPGPDGANGCVYDKIFRDGGCEIAGPVEDQMVVSMDYDSLVISDADLRLIAAAPELLEALERIDSLANDATVQRGRMVKSLQEIARAVLAKARP